MGSGFHRNGRLIASLEDQEGRSEKDTFMSDADVTTRTAKQRCVLELVEQTRHAFAKIIGGGFGVF